MREGDSDLGSFVVDLDAIGFEKKDLAVLDLGEGSRAAVFIGEAV